MELTLDIVAAQADLEVELTLVASEATSSAEDDCFDVVELALWLALWLVLLFALWLVLWLTRVLTLGLKLRPMLRPKVLKPMMPKLTNALMLWRTLGRMLVTSPKL